MTIPWQGCARKKRLETPVKAVHPTGVTKIISTHKPLEIKLEILYRTLNI